MLAGVFDVVDGAVARRTSAECAFGSNLDSLADLVSFGAAPALVVFLSLLHVVPVAGIGACLGFVLCGAWRLARFPLVRNARHFVGLPIPAAGVIAAVLAALGPPPGLMLAVTLALALLMVSAAPFPTPDSLHRLRRPRDAEATAPSVVRE